MKIRTTVPGDIPDLQAVLHGTDLFPPELLPDMLDDMAPGEAVWLTALDGERAVGFCHAVAEALTEGTWNMLAIAVLPARQGQGIGGKLVARIENDLRKAGHRLLIVDTSGVPEFEGTRAFYRGHGYVQEACIRDFWSAGDNKVTFRKEL